MAEARPHCREIGSTSLDIANSEVDPRRLLPDQKLNGHVAEPTSGDPVSRIGVIVVGFRATKGEDLDASSLGSFRTEILARKRAGNVGNGPHDDARSDRQVPQQARCSEEPTRRAARADY